MPEGIAFIEVHDDPNNSTLAPFDTGTIKSPGSDIDSLELNSGIFATGCKLTGTTACENDSAAAIQAEGAPNATGMEETGTYTSLNGGSIRCRWLGGTASSPNDTVTVVEIGGTTGTNLEQYRIRLSEDSGECLPFSSFVAGDHQFSGSGLF